MAGRLNSNLNSRYIEAANRLKPKTARRRIVAYVESYDDIYFWRTVLSKFEDDKLYFEVMLPSRGKLARGKKSVLMNIIGDGVGRDMIACVDADYDYMMQEKNETSKKVTQCPYVFHSYVYAIENYQCYAPSLHNVCVMVTLNDHAIFDFEEFFKQYSEICFPLFVWSVWSYEKGHHGEFSLMDFCHVIDLGRFNVQTPQIALDNLRQKVGKKINYLQRKFPHAKESYQKVKTKVKELGVTPQTTYLYIQGHHLFDVIVVPMLTKICNQLRQERETEIYHTSVHRTQMRNELACYENSIADVRSVLRRNVGYDDCPEFIRLQDDVRRFLEMI